MVALVFHKTLRQILIIKRRHHTAVKLAPVTYDINHFSSLVIQNKTRTFINGFSAKSA